jgi:hypothetical protein
MRLEIITAGIIKGITFWDMRTVVWNNFTYVSEERNACIFRGRRFKQIAIFMEICNLHHVHLTEEKWFLEKSDDCDLKL